MCPHEFKRGRVANPGNHATSGTQNAGKPSAYGGGKGGSRGAKPPWQGVWGMYHHEFKRGGESSTLATTPRVGPKTLANPKPTRAGKGGGGGEAPSQGVWGMCPHEFKRGGELSTLATTPRVGPKTLQTLSLRGWGRGVQGGEAPMAGGLGDVPPRI